MYTILQMEENENSLFIQYDFTATPFTIKGKKKEFFSHVIYDFGLVEAMQNMLVKQIFIEKSSFLSNKIQQLPDTEKLMITAHKDEAKKVIELSEVQKHMIDVGLAKLENLQNDFDTLKINKKPVMFLMADNNDEANVISDTLLAEHGDDTGLLIDIANLAIDDGDYARAADFYVKVVDLNESDTDATNDADNKSMLVAAGTWYSTPNVGRFDDAIVVLDRAADLETIPTDNTMLMRLRTYYNYGKEKKTQAGTETDPVKKAELTERSTELFNRAVEIGIAMTNNFPQTADGFFYLSLSQLELGDYPASDANYKTYEELSPGS